ncbi:MAG: M23 family metallopeptidase [Cyanobacteria bacterium SID2]|nr:M23 family metallopeptidase [Cyanobacteria bacterium SID2]MBP0003841.1 M23 family metallopeptidase [Cyanobacteria bacterium SBC]
MTADFDSVLMSKHRLRSGMVAATSAIWTVLASSATALEVRVAPDRPRLGDTLSVMVRTDDPDLPHPTVSVNGRTYETFLVGTNRYRAFLPTTPLEAPGTRTLQVSGDGAVETVSVVVSDRSFPIQEIWLSPETNAIEGTDYEFDLVDAFKQLVSPERLWTGPFRPPSDGPVTTVYGVRRYYNGEWAENYYHRGIDYAAPAGAPVLAAARGRVALVGRESQGFELHGNTVGLDHGQGVTTIYLHLSRIDVREGQLVEAGQPIGAVGSTGISTGPHLHWGLYVRGESVDPLPWQSLGLK